MEPTSEPLGPRASFSTSFQPLGEERGWDSLTPWLPLLPVTLFRQSFDGTFLSISPHIQTFAQVSPCDWIESIDFWDIVHEADQERVEEHFELTRARTEVQSIEYRLRLPGQDRVVWVSEQRRLSMGRGDLACFEASWIDITTRRLAEQRMSPASWQRTLASLTPGVAHDLNNHFASILALSDNFVRKTAPDHPFSEGLRIIRDSVQQAAKLLQRLVSLHLGRTGDRRYHNLDELLTESVDLLRHTISRRVGFHCDFAPGRFPVYLDAMEFKKAFISIVKNGVDAIPNPGSGSIRFSSRLSAQPPQDALDPLPLHAPGYLGISITDTGSGVSASHRSRLFQPWYSTKSPNEGAGLALNAVRRFANQSGGSVAYQPGAETGASFTLWLPVSDLTEGDKLAQSRVPLIYVAGPASATDETSAELRSWGLRVVSTARNPIDCLQDEDVGPDAVILLHATDPSWLAVLARLIRNRRWMTKIICERSPDHPFLHAAEGVKPDLSLPAPVAGAHNHSRLRSVLLTPIG